MAFWKQKHNQTEGFSLIEVMVSIAILGFVAVPMFTGLLFSYQLNKRSDEKLLAQLAVSSAVETIMAEGFDARNTPEHENCSIPDSCYHTRFPNVSVTVTQESTSEHPAIGFRVASSRFSDISVDTFARPYVAPEEVPHDE